jgi:hypothetical protein
MQYIQSQCNRNDDTHHMSRMILSVNQYMIWKTTKCYNLSEQSSLVNSKAPYSNKKDCLH